MLAPFARLWRAQGKQDGDPGRIVRRGLMAEAVKLTAAAKAAG
jgi:hypothetical protein